jgi:hypothetical protein
VGVSRERVGVAPWILYIWICLLKHFMLDHASDFYNASARYGPFNQHKSRRKSMVNLKSNISKNIKDKIFLTCYY